MAWYGKGTGAGTIDKRPRTEGDTTDDGDGYWATMQTMMQQMFGQQEQNLNATMRNSVEQSEGKIMKEHGAQTLVRRIRHLVAKPYVKRHTLSTVVARRRQQQHNMRRGGTPLQAKGFYGESGRRLIGVHTLRKITFEEGE